MKVHRFITVDRICDGRVLFCQEDVTTSDHASAGAEDPKATVEILAGGNIVFSTQINCGIRTRVRLVPACAQRREMWVKQFKETA